MRKRTFAIILLIFVCTQFYSCGKTVYTSQSQQTWNEHKGAQSKKVVKKKDVRDKKRKN
jgi:hypothetical protein